MFALKIAFYSIYQYWKSGRRTHDEGLLGDTDPLNTAVAFLARGTSLTLALENPEAYCPFTAVIGGELCALLLGRTQSECIALNRQRESFPTLSFRSWFWVMSQKGRILSGGQVQNNP